MSVIVVSVVPAICVVIFLVWFHRRPQSRARRRKGYLYDGEFQALGGHSHGDDSGGDCGGDGGSSD